MQCILFQTIRRSPSQRNGQFVVEIGSSHDLFLRRRRERVVVVALSREPNRRGHGDGRDGMAEWACTKNEVLF